MPELEAQLPRMCLAELAAVAGDMQQAAASDEEALLHESWLLSWRSAVQQQLQQQQQAGAMHATGAELASLVSALAAVSVPVVQPLPIGFGTPRWSRPAAAADPAAWEAWLAQLACAYAAAQQQQWHEQQQQQPEEVLEEALADFIISLACAMRWANVNVNEAETQSPGFRQRVLACLHEQAAEAAQQPQQAQTGAAAAAAAPGPEQQQQQQQQHAAGDSAASSSGTCHHPLALGGSLLHRVTATCLLMLLPPPRQLLSAFFAATQPQQFGRAQLQALLRGCLYVGVAPPEAWLRGLVSEVREYSVTAQRPELVGWLEVMRFCSSERPAAPWLRDTTALLEEFCC